MNQKQKEAKAIELAKLAEVQRISAEMEKAKETARIAAEQEKLRLAEIERVSAEIEKENAKNTAEQDNQKQQSVQVLNMRYQILAQGAEVKDTKTGLVWQRCSVGQTWNGRTCSGAAERFNFDQAQALAAHGWRVPSKDELASLIVEASSPTIDVEVFPATPSSLFWSSTLATGSSESAWGVYFDYGRVSGGYRNGYSHVRLVR